MNDEFYGPNAYNNSNLSALQWTEWAHRLCENNGYLAPLDIYGFGFGVVNSNAGSNTAVTIYYPHNLFNEVVMNGGEYTN